MNTLPQQKFPRRYLRHALLWAAALVGVMWVTGAGAQEDAIPVGAPVTARGSVVCDTAGQVIEILSTAARDGAEAGRAVFLRYRAARNEFGEPVCVVDPGAVWMLKGAVTQVDGVPVGERTVTVYVVEIGGAGPRTFFASSLRPVGPEVPDGDPA